MAKKWTHIRVQESTRVKLGDYRKQGESFDAMFLRWMNSKQRQVRR